MLEAPVVNIRDGNLYLPRPVHNAANAGLRMGLDLLLVVLWLTAITTLVVTKYGPGLVS